MDFKAYNEAARCLNAAKASGNPAAIAAAEAVMEVQKALYAEYRAAEAAHAERLNAERLAAVKAASYRNNWLLAEAVALSTAEGIEPQDYLPLLGERTVDRMLEVSYTYNFRAFDCCGHQVVLIITKRYEVSFRIDGEESLRNIPPVKGGLILRRLLKAWLELIKTVPPGTELTCIPFSADGGFERRLKIYKRIGFRERENSTLFFKA
jgi:hypothetical protein